MFTGCAVSIDERRHQAALEADEEFNADVEEEVERIMREGASHYPYSGEHIAKAIDAEESVDQVCELEELLTDAAAKIPANHTKAYDLLRAICRQYWIVEAEDAATNTVLARSGD